MFSQSFSEQGINLVVSDQDAEHSARLLTQNSGDSPAHGRSIYALDTMEQVATVSVIGLAGNGSGSIASRTCDPGIALQACTPGIAVQAFAALGKHQVRVVAVAQEAAEDSVTFCIPAADVADTVRFLHRELGLENGKGDEI
jgi:aspartokinase